jgi:predicted nucleic acid-binding protein
MVLARELRLTFDDRIEAEYRQVLARPRLAIPIIRAAAFLSILQFQDHVSALPWHGVSTPDLEDLKFLEAAQQASEKILVTGNLRHYPPACRGAVRVLTPRQAWEYLVGQDR